MGPVVCATAWTTLDTTPVAVSSRGLATSSGTSDRRTVLDWMSVLRIPIILVAGTYVGTMSHTLTSLEVLVRRNLDVAAVVVSESAGSAASLEETVATVQRFANSIDVVAIPRLAPDAGDHPAFAHLAALM